MIGAIAMDHGDDPAVRARLPLYQQHALEAIAACGTEACGVHVETCDHCSDRRLVPNTCGNRCCPHCQGRERAEWVEARTEELLPCGYFHAVLTLPPELRGLAAAFPAVVLGALLRAASDAIQHLCRDPRHLGGEVGQLAVLHTWKRDLGWHPHVHLIITAGGWNDERQQWIPARRYGRQRRAFLLPVALVCCAFQRRLRRLLLDAYDHGDFVVGPHHANVGDISSRIALQTHLDHSLKRPWVIRIEPPFGGPQQLLKYLGAYVNRVAISPKRILAYHRETGTVTYTWRTNADPDTPQEATIPATEFLCRFAQHILPPRFQRIRFRGLWSTAHRATKLQVVQRALGVRTPPPPNPPPPPSERNACLICGRGHYHRTPGPCPRPSPAKRRRMLQRLRIAARHTQTPTEVTIPA